MRGKRRSRRNGFLSFSKWLGQNKSHRPTGLAMSRGPAMEPLEHRRMLAADPVLLASIQNAGVVRSSSPENLIDVDGVVFFSAFDATHRQELWKSDGTFAGTTLVKDIWPGTGASEPEQLINVGGTLFFTANDGVNNRELWKSDGTEAGTVLVKDVFPGPNPSPTKSGGEPILIAADGDILYFFGDDNTSSGLWKSDGTTAGTVLVKELDLNTAVDDNSILFNGTLYFEASNQIYRTDGTEAGTVPITNLPASSQGPTEFVEFDGKLFFGTVDGLRSTDGSTGGEVLIKSLSERPSGKTVVGNTLFFRIGLDELWRSDGTTAGTWRVKTISGFNNFPSAFTALGDNLIFSAGDANGRELWISDGTTAGTTVLKDILPGSEGSFPSSFTEFNNQLFFSADGPQGRELWTTDGTEAGTVLFSDIMPGSGNSDPVELLVVGNTLFLSMRSPEAGKELWKSDGTVAGTVMVKDLFGNANPYSDAMARRFTQVDDTVFFSAGFDLWSIDDTQSAASLVANFNPGISSPAWFTEYNGELIFAADDGSTGLDPWRSDGTAVGTTVIKDINPSAQSLLQRDPVVSPFGFIYPGYSVGAFTPFQGELFFTADDGVIGAELWKTDGTAGGTVLVKDINQGALGSYQGSYAGGLTRFSGGLVESGGNLFFGAYTEALGFELWKSDGTASGTVLVKDITSGNEAASGADLTTNFYYGLRELTDVNGTLFFSTQTGDGDYELWKSDGTEAGTVRVKDILPGTGTSYPRYLTEFNNTLFFVADDGQNGRELWKSDGTEAGTVLVKDIIPGPGGSSFPGFFPGSGPNPLVVADSTLFFTADDGTTGFELWKTDGTTAGTVLVADIVPGSGFSSPDQITPILGGVVFTADDGVNGRELWRSDGTAAGTQIVSDLWTGSEGSDPDELAYIGTKLYFAANDGNIGRQPWSVELGPVANAGGPYSGVEGTLIALSGSAENVVGLLFEWDLDNDGQFDDAVGENVNFNATTDGVFTVGLRIDGPGGPTDTTTVTVVPQTVDIGGPYSGNEGSTIALNASSNFAGLFEWDLDNDGQFNDAVGQNVSFSNNPDNGVFTIGLRVGGPGGLIDSTTVTVVNVAPTAFFTGIPDIYRGETVTFAFTAIDPSPVDQAGLFTFEIDWDGNGTVDETLAGVPNGTAVQHTFPTLAANNIQVRATDKDGGTGSFSQTPITVSPHVLRDDGQGNIDLIWGGTPGLDAVFAIGSGPALALFVQFENSLPVNRLDLIGSAATGKIILYGYGFVDVLAAELANGNVVEIHGGDGDDVIAGGFLGDALFGDAGNDLILGGTQGTDGDDMLFGGSGRDTLFGHIGADTLDGGSGEDLLVSDRLNFTGSTAQAVIAIDAEWKSARPYAERVSNILGITSSGVNGSNILQPGVNILNDGDVDSLIGGLGDLDWFFYGFGQDLLGDAIEVDEEETDSNL